MYNLECRFESGELYGFGACGRVLHLKMQKMPIFSPLIEVSFLALGVVKR